MVLLNLLLPLLLCLEFIEFFLLCPPVFLVFIVQRDILLMEADTGLLSAYDESIYSLAAFSASYFL